MGDRLPIENGDHWNELRALRTDVETLRRNLRNAETRNDSFRKAIWDKVAAIVVGAAGVAGWEYFTKRTGLHLPGGTP